MRKNQTSSLLKKQDTYVFIDVSNIRLACRKTLGWELDFYKLFEYFKKKYKNLKDVRYYEGLAVGDTEKKEELSKLEAAGYMVCSLERKAYSEPAVYRSVRCRKCGHTWDAKVLERTVKKKSNVDVYLASDMLVQASLATYPIRLILVSCDGDYAEAIKNAVRLNKNVSVMVLATPTVKDVRRNTLSVRLKNLYNDINAPRYILNNIADIRSQIDNEG